MTKVNKILGTIILLCLIVLGLPTVMGNVVINEILPVPMEVDWNGNGVVSDIDDEFVELYNNGTTTVNISQWQINDTTTVRHIIPDGVLLGPWEFYTVFGSSASTGTLDLSIGGDDVHLINISGALIDTTSYQGIWVFGGSDISTGRSIDGGSSTFRFFHYPTPNSSNTGGCIIPRDNTKVNDTVILCSGTYQINDTGFVGVIVAIDDNAKIICNNTHLVGNSTGSGSDQSVGIFINNSKDPSTLKIGLTNVSVIGCNISNYYVDLKIEKLSNASILNNTLKNAGFSAIYAESMDNSILEYNLGFNSSVGGYGLLLNNSYNISLYFNRFINNSYFGIRNYNSNFNRYVNNTVEGASASQTLGLFISDNNAVINNTILGHGTADGLIVSFSSFNNISNNKILNTDDDLDVVGGSVKRYFNNSIDTTNTINDKIVYYFFNLDNLILENLVPGFIGVAFVNNAKIRNNNLTEVDAISLDFTNNSIIENNFINGTADEAAIMMTFSSHNNLYQNTLSRNIVGISLEYSTYNNITANKIFLNTFGTKLYMSANLIFRDNNVSKNNLDSGYFISGTSHTSFINETVMGNAMGFELELFSNNNTVIGSIISSSSTDVSLDDSNITLLNVTFDKTKASILDNSSSLTVKWFLDLRVVDAFTGQPINLSNVSILDNTGALISSVLTNASGLIPTQNLTEYIQNNASKTFFTDYIINVTAPGYYPKLTSVNLTSNRFLTIGLTNVTCLEPSAGLKINYSVTFCPGTYQLNSTGPNGVIRVTGKDIIVMGNNTELMGYNAGRGMWAGYGILVNGSNNVTVMGFNVSNYDVDVYVENTINSFILNNSLKNANFGLVAGDSNNSIIKDNLLFNNTNGFEVDDSNNNTLSFNRIMNNSINIDESNFNSFINNTIEGRFNIMFSHNNMIINNTIMGNGFGYGVDISSYSRFHTFLNNKFIDNDGIYLSDGNSKDEFNHTIDASNTLNGKPMYYYFDKNNLVLENLDAGFIGVAFGNNTTIRNNNLTGAQGIKLFYAGNAIVKGNLLSGRREGIYVKGSSQIELSQNTVSSYFRGIEIQGSSFLNITGNKLSNNSKGIYSQSSSYSNLLQNNVSSNAYGIEIRYSNSFNITSNGLFLNSVGINIIDSKNLILRNNNLSNQTSTGYYVGDSDTINVLFINETVKYVPNAFIFNDDMQNVTIIDSIINSTAVDIYISQINANITLINVTYDPKKVEISSLYSFFVAKWFLDILVVDSATGKPINLSNVTAFDNAGRFAFSDLTNSLGFIPRKNLTEYIQDNAIKTFFTNYTINVSALGYKPNSISINLTSSKLVVLNLTVRNLSTAFNASGFSGSTTNFSNFNASQLSNMSPYTLILGTDYGTINFSDFIQFDTNKDYPFWLYINISYNSISINSSVLSELNKSAAITFHNLTFSDPEPLLNGEVCPSSVCKEVSYNGRTFILNVTHFSTYSTRETPISQSEGTGGTSRGGGGGGYSPPTLKTPSATSPVTNEEKKKEEKPVEKTPVKEEEAAKEELPLTITGEAVAKLPKGNPFIGSIIIIAIVSIGLGCFYYVKGKKIVDEIL